MIGVRRTPKRRESSANKGADRFSKRALAHVESDRDRRVSQIAEEQGLNMVSGRPKTHTSSRGAALRCGEPCDTLRHVG